MLTFTKLSRGTNARGPARSIVESPGKHIVYVSWKTDALNPLILDTTFFYCGNNECFGGIPRSFADRVKLWPIHGPIGTGKISTVPYRTT